MENNSLQDLFLKQRHINLHFFYTKLKDHKVQIKINDQIIEGLVLRISPQTQQLILRKKKKEQITLQLKDINSLKIINDFTNEDIKIIPIKEQLKQRQLVKWDTNVDEQQTQCLDKATEKNFDQFAANESKFGVVAVFDENNYTSNLDLQAVTPEMKIIAQQEFNYLQTGNRQSTDDENESDEEKKYSAVLGTGNYKNQEVKKQLKKNKNKKNKANPSHQKIPVQKTNLGKDYIFDLLQASLKVPLDQVKPSFNNQNKEIDHPVQ